MSKKPPAPASPPEPDYGPLYEAMVEFFKQEDWPYSLIEDQPVLSLGFHGENGRWLCYAQVRPEHEQFVFYSVCPVTVPPEKRLAMAEFITRANYGLIIGNFELDFNDGETRYKTSVDVEGGSLTLPLIRQCVYANVLMMDQYLPGILALVFSDTEPADALAQVER